MENSYLPELKPRVLKFFFKTLCVALKKKTQKLGLPWAPTSATDAGPNVDNLVGTVRVKGSKGWVSKLGFKKSEKLRRYAIEKAKP